MNQLLDTNVVSALRRPERESAAFGNWLRKMDANSSFISCLTWLEIHSGALKKARTDATQGQLLLTWFEQIHHEFRHRTLWFDDACAATTSPLLLLRSRSVIDTMIAGIALANNLSLVTRNVSDFTDIPGLTLINPWQS